MRARPDAILAAVSSSASQRMSAGAALRRAEESGGLDRWISALGAEGADDPAHIELAVGTRDIACQRQAGDDQDDKNSHARDRPAGERGLKRGGQQVGEKDPS